MKTPEDFLAENGFTVAREIDTQALVSAFMREMERGLRGEESSLLMVPTYVGVSARIPAGARVAVLDAGGTNFRSGVVEMPFNVTHKENRPMPGAKDSVDVESFYSAFATEIARVKPYANVDKIGWCFSYPAEATPDLDARLVRWTKNIQAPEIVGQYVGAGLKKRVGNCELAIVNDTVATLLAAKAFEGDRMYSSYVGFILGTGTNCAYVERVENITKLKTGFHRDKMIINAESGAFDKIPQSAFDKAVDEKSVQPGQGRLEKMISGAYLGPIAFEIWKGAAKEGLFSRKAAAALSGLNSLETIDYDNFCAGYRKEGRENPLDTIFAAPDDAKMAKRLGLTVLERAAVLTAIHLAAFIIKSGEGNESGSPVAISVDGSTYYKTRSIPFADTVKRVLDDILVNRRNIHFEITEHLEDAPMVGAAIAALM